MQPGHLTNFTARWAELNLLCNFLKLQRWKLSSTQTATKLTAPLALPNTEIEKNHIPPEANITLHVHFMEI